jgi:hypothetical protein
LWRQTDDAVRRQEAKWERSFRKLFAKQQATTIARLESPSRSKRAAEGRVRADELFDPRFWEPVTFEVADDLNRDLWHDAYVLEGSRLGVSFGLLNPLAEEMILTRSNQLAGGVTNTTYEAVQAAMAEGVAEGDDIPGIARRIRSVFGDASALRATTIARTEVVGGFNAATYSGLVSLDPSVGIVGVEWIATRDARTRETHVHADGQAVWMGQPFQVGGSSMLYPGDPNGAAKETVNCRCTLTGLTAESLQEKAELVSAAPMPAVPLDRASAALAMVRVGEFDEARVRRALEVAV